MKACKKCNIEKEFSCYQKRSDSGKYRNICMTCNNLQVKNRRDDTRREKEKEYKLKNLEKIREYQNEYRINHKKERNEREFNRRKNDTLYRAKNNMIKSISKIFKRKGMSKKDNTPNIIGCTYDEFKMYIESKFEPWMNWENYGLYERGVYDYGWDIDHIIPISSAKNEEELLKLNHYTNLQPLCSFINRDIKKHKLIYE